MWVVARVVDGGGSAKGEDGGCGATEKQRDLGKNGNFRFFFLVVQSPRVSEKVMKMFKFKVDFNFNFNFNFNSNFVAQAWKERPGDTSGLACSVAHSSCCSLVVIYVQAAR